LRVLCGTGSCLRRASGPVSCANARTRTSNEEKGMVLTRCQERIKVSFGRYSRQIHMGMIGCRTRRDHSNTWSSCMRHSCTCKSKGNLTQLCRGLLPRGFGEWYLHARQEGGRRSNSQRKISTFCRRDCRGKSTGMCLSERWDK
jgi:hypothetical protein